MFEDNLPIDFSLGADDLLGIIKYFLFDQGLYYFIIFTFW